MLERLKEAVSYLQKSMNVKTYLGSDEKKAAYKNALEIILKNMEGAEVPEKENDSLKRKRHNEYGYADYIRSLTLLELSLARSDYEEAFEKVCFLVKSKDGFIEDARFFMTLRMMLYDYVGDKEDEQAKGDTVKDD